MNTPRPVYYLINHGLPFRWCRALADEGFSTVEELEHARELWKRDHPDTRLERLISIRGFGKNAADTLLTALDNHHAGRDDFPTQHPFQVLAGQHRARVLDGTIQHGDSIGTWRDIQARERLSDNAMGHLARTLLDTGYATFYGSEVIAIDPRQPYSASWADSIPHHVRDTLRPAVELLRHNVSLLPASSSPVPVRALEGIGDVEFDHTRTSLKVLTASTHRDSRWRTLDSWYRRDEFVSRVLFG